MTAAVLLLAACGPQEPKLDLYARATAARGLAAQPPATPSQHYFLSGHMAFPSEGVGERVQPCEILLGGAEHLRVVLKSGVLTQVFLVENAEQAWLRRPNQAFESHPAERLAKETWVRWLVARFPWDQRAVLPSAAVELYKGGERDIKLPSPFGECVFAVDRNFLPLQVKLPDLVLDLEGNASAPGQPQFPRDWHWRHAGQQWREHIDRVDHGVLAFDEAFLPPDRALPRSSGFRGSVAVPGATLEVDGERFGLVEFPATRFLVGPWPADWAAAWVREGVLESTTWRLVEQAAPQAALALRGPPPAALPSGVVLREEPAGTWLRWRTRQRFNAVEGDARLRAAAAANATLQVRGPSFVFLGDAAGDGWNEILLRAQRGPGEGPQ